MRLLEPLALGSTTAPNRVLFGPHETNLGRGRAIADRHLAYYERRAAGGTGILVTEEASVHETDWPYERAPLAADCGEGWEAVATMARRHDTVAIAALGHAGGQGASAYSQREMWAPSGVPEVNTREVPKIMEHEDIEAVVRGFGTATARAVGAGLHGVEINGGQHSLLRQFLSGLTNLRDDDYGADRSRFAREVLHAVRVAAGDRIVGLRLSCDELAPWAGIVPDAAAVLAVSFLPWIDYLVVVRGGIFSVAATRPDGHDEPGFNLGLVEQIHAAVAASAGQVPVFAQGSIVDIGQAEWAIDDGRCDGVEMTRAQIADADLVRKARSGHADRIRPCILCNQTCAVRDGRNPLVSCVVDPRSGHELDDADPEAPRDPATRPREVLVVGAGVAGLECARVAAGRGDNVSVRERSSEVGGMLRTAAAGAGRNRLALFADWLEAECRRAGVTISTDDPVDDAGLAAAQSAYDHVVVATGSTAGWRDYRVTRAATVIDASDVLAAIRSSGYASVPDGPLAIWDPVGGPIGVSVAEALVGLGHDITLITPDLIVGTLLSRSGDLAPANTRLAAAGVNLRKRAVVRSVEKAGVVVEDRFTAERSTLAAVALIDAGPRLPAPSSAPLGETVIGDAVAPRTVYEAVLDARRAALGAG